MELTSLSWQHWLVLISFVISLIGGIAYLRDMFAGRSKPNLVSWGLWALAPLIATGAAISAGADTWGTARVFMSGFVPFSIFAFGLFVRQSYWKLTKFDFFCGALSLVALGAWLIADAPVTAILLAVGADFLACIPTISKALKSPETETALTFFMGLTASVITVPAIPVWTIENIAFQAYLIGINLILFGVVAYGKFLKKRISLSI
jgi:hypothetical protein